MQTQICFAPTVLNRRLAILSAFVLILFAGCGESTSPVTGTVTLDGIALPKVTVAFYPVEGGRGNSIANTNDNGEFELNYTNSDKGALPGKYKVLITKTKVVNNREVETIPLRYNQESTTVVEVTNSDENFFEFKLDSRGK